MKVSILGYWGAYPGTREATSGYLIQTRDQKILVDCGSGVLAQLQRYISLKDVDAVVLSHFHTDHIADIFSLQYATMINTQLGKRDSLLTIYAPDKDQDTFQSLNYKEYCRAEAISADSAIDIGGVKVRFIETVHPVPCLAMRFEYRGKSFTYSADTGWTDNLIDLAERTDLFICESSLYNKQKGQINGHLTAGEAGKMAQQAKVKQFCLTHLPHYGEHHQLIYEASVPFQGRVEFPYTGKTWTLV
jgi:ribonuclease BN (tRNA processing enzyme)